MVRKKKQDIAIIIAVIGAMGAIIAGYYHGLGDTQWKERPIIDASFGDQASYPKNELQYDGTNYYVDLLSANRGKSDGKLFFIIESKGAQIRFDKNLLWEYKQSLHFTIHPNPVMHPYKVYVLPDPDADMISFQLLTQDSEDKPQFQEFNPYIPTKLMYKKSDGNYKLIS